ncbi:hypothetical protein A3K79_03850 [Candidatus Bathyarchaeota archaeon RBG_13_46_16b]|nr:MAG: hypothetical protein A3K79_03850 [Candidatus Bathyarchaeota archaeon RBG_13_46_16b]
MIEVESTKPVVGPRIIHKAIRKSMSGKPVRSKILLLRKPMIIMEPESISASVTGSIALKSFFPPLFVSEP